MLTVNKPHGKYIVSPHPKGHELSFRPTGGAFRSLGVFPKGSGGKVHPKLLAKFDHHNATMLGVTNPGRKVGAKLKKSAKLDVDVDQGIYGVGNIDDATSTPGVEHETSTPGSDGPVMATLINPNAKCNGCIHYHTNLKACQVGLQPAMCGDGSCPEKGFSPMAQNLSAFLKWRDKKGNFSESPTAQAGQQGMDPALSVAYGVQVLGDSWVTKAGGGGLVVHIWRRMSPEKRAAHVQRAIARHKKMGKPVSAKKYSTMPPKEFFQHMAKKHKIGPYASKSFFKSMATDLGIDRKELVNIFANDLFKQQMQQGESPILAKVKARGHLAGGHIGRKAGGLGQKVPPVTHEGAATPMHALAAKLGVPHNELSILAHGVKSPQEFASRLRSVHGEKLRQHAVTDAQLHDAHSKHTGKQLLNSLEPDMEKADPKVLEMVKSILVKYGVTGQKGKQPPKPTIFVRQPVTGGKVKQAPKAAKMVKSDVVLSNNPSDAEIAKAMAAGGGGGALTFGGMVAAPMDIDHGYVGTSYGLPDATGFVKIEEEEEPKPPERLVHCGGVPSSAFDLARSESLEKARQHVAYTRKTKSGKIVQVKGTAAPKSKVPETKHGQCDFCGETADLHKIVHYDPHDDYHYHEHVCSPECEDEARIEHAGDMDEKRQEIDEQNAEDEMNANWDEHDALAAKTKLTPKEASRLTALKKMVKEYKAQGWG